MARSGLAAAEAYRYALSQPVSAQVVGLTTLDQLKEAVSLARALAPMSAAEQDAGVQQHSTGAVGGRVLQVGGQLLLEGTLPRRGRLVAFLAHSGSWGSRECTVNLTFPGVPD